MDVDEEEVGALNEGRSYLGHIPDQQIADAVATGRFEATLDFDRCSKVDAVIIAVPTPLSPHRDPDLSYVEATCRSIGPHLTADTLIILESTTILERVARS